ncbi:LutC/YkgG family protein [Ligilactobacillus apodemi]|uniref:LutC/YkgG family protein n=1 Tax=Ligilactobacillus apodemi TaxID=307126 RepID=UPI00214BC874|nr:lactate utilization protein C [Ligilactobacillus apodemi]MCR1900997.1 lactate utilization protein C [Ligilactobacillus apodemi]
MTEVLKANDPKNREDFLDAIAKKANRPRHELKNDPLKLLNDLPETTLADKTPAELLDLAKKNSELIHVDFKTVKADQLAANLTKFIEEKEIKSLMLPSFAADKWADFEILDWKDELELEHLYFWDEANGRDNLINADKSDAAIGFADYLLAESGTITAATVKEQGRGFHFLPTHYLAIVPQSKILPRMRQAIDRYDEALKQDKLKTSNINFISGPSNSGDIEMVLIVGVHGPLDMTYVVIEDR